MNPTTILSVAILLLLATSAPANATHEPCTGTIFTVETPAETVYVEQRDEGFGGVRHWVHVEANAIEGLQSGGDSILFKDQQFYADPCLHPNPDVLII